VNPNAIFQLYSIKVFVAVLRGIEIFPGGNGWDLNKPVFYGFAQRVFIDNVLELDCVTAGVKVPNFAGLGVPS